MRERNRAVRSLVVLLAAAVGGLTLSAATSLEENCADGPRSEVRLLTFNLRYGTASDGENAWPHRRDLVVEILRREPWDFVGMQEALRFQIEELAVAVPEFRWIGRGRDDGDEAGEHVPIFYRGNRWRLVHDEHFWLSETPEKPGSRSWGNQLPRMVTAGRFVEKSSGKAVWIFNTHFDHQSQESRERSARLLAERVSRRDPPDPVVVMGDFNAGEENSAVRFLKGTVPGSPVKLIDSFRLIHPSADDVGTFHGFRGGTAGEKIDYVFVEPGTAVCSADILRISFRGKFPSDHYPVSATIELK